MLFKNNYYTALIKKCIHKRYHKPVHHPCTWTIWILEDLSTDRTSFNFTDKILHDLNNEMHAGRISCDLAKTSDCVNHVIQLPKLSFYWLWGTAEQWFKLYLHNRKQQTELKSSIPNYKTYSHWGIIKHGVLQGQVPGPLLFLTYINNVPQPSTCNINENSLLISELLFHLQTLTTFKTAWIMPLLAWTNGWRPINLHRTSDKTNVMNFCTNSKTCIN
jgi:hypothetical protein